MDKEIEYLFLMFLEKKNHTPEEYLIITEIKEGSLPVPIVMVKNMVIGLIGKKMARQIGKNHIPKGKRVGIGYTTLMMG